MVRSWPASVGFDHMIRRAFLCRMAHAAMAGMLGVELMVRAPKVEGLLKMVEGSSLEGLAPGHYVAYLSADQTKVVGGAMVVEAVDYANKTITVRTHAHAMADDYVFTASP